MIRAANLRAEVFIDEYDDGTVRAEAMMLRIDDRRVFSRGAATFVPSDGIGERIDDEVIAAWALFDLTQKLIDHTSSARPGGQRSFTGTITIDGATMAVGRPIDAAPAAKDENRQPGQVHR
jgi:hypothetical protein